MTIQSKKILKYGKINENWLEDFPQHIAVKPNAFYQLLIDSNDLTLEFTFNDNDDLTVDLPLLQGYEYDCNIEWGDGSTTEVKTADDKNKTHIYLNPGIYIVKIIGTCSTFNNYEYEIAYGKNAWNNLTAILSWRRYKYFIIKWRIL